MPSMAVAFFNTPTLHALLGALGYFFWKRNGWALSSLEVTLLEPVDF